MAFMRRLIQNDMRQQDDQRLPASLIRFTKKEREALIFGASLAKDLPRIK